MTILRGYREPGRYDGLTPKQADALSVLRRCAKNGVMPTGHELSQRLGLKRQSSAHHFFVSLEQRGYIRRDRGRARGVSLIEDPRPGEIVADVLGRVATRDLVAELKSRGFRFAGSWA